MSHAEIRTDGDLYIDGMPFKCLENMSKVCNMSCEHFREPEQLAPLGVEYTEIQICQDKLLQFDTFQDNR